MLIRDRSQYHFSWDYVIVNGRSLTHKILCSRLAFTNRGRATSPARKTPYPEKWETAGAVACPRCAGRISFRHKSPPGRQPLPQLWELIMGEVKRHGMQQHDQTLLLLRVLT